MGDGRLSTGEGNVYSSDEEVSEVEAGGEIFSGSFLTQVSHSKVLAMEVTYLDELTT